MKRIMALDVGERRIGVAVSDPLGIIARSLAVVKRDTDETAIARIKTLMDEEDVGRLIVGFPRSLSGAVGPQARAVEAFARQIESAIDVPVEMWDERLSTVTAVRVLTERGQSAREQKQTIDAVAAAVILQDYLDAQRMRASMRDENEDEDE
ncbi:MAG: Holliday junction resolvase RuvX [Anaerolineae bacterium]